MADRCKWCGEILVNHKPHSQGKDCCCMAHQVAYDLAEKTRKRTARQSAQVNKHRRKVEERLKMTTKVRRCLTCSEEFVSEGPWNRICESCNTKNANVFVKERHWQTAEAGFEEEPE